MRDQQYIDTMNVLSKLSLPQAVENTIDSAVEYLSEHTMEIHGEHLDSILAIITEQYVNENGYAALIRVIEHLRVEPVDPEPFIGDQI